MSTKRKIGAIDENDGKKTKLDEDPRINDEGFETDEVTKINEGSNMGKRSKVDEAFKRNVFSEKDEGCMVNVALKLDEGSKLNAGIKMDEDSGPYESKKRNEGAKMPEGAQIDCQLDTVMASLFDGDEDVQLTEQIFQQVLYAFEYIMK